MGKKRNQSLRTNFNSNIPGILGDVPVVPPCPVFTISETKYGPTTNAKRHRKRPQAKGYNRTQNK